MKINKQTTAQGVTTEKDNGIAVLEQDNDYTNS